PTRSCAERARSGGGSRTFSTPACPFAARPHRYARPIMTALAPSARALATSPPRRMPPSISTSTWSPTPPAPAAPVHQPPHLVPARLGHRGQGTDRRRGAVEVVAAVVGHRDRGDAGV